MVVLETLLSAVAQKYPLDSSSGVFLSVFDAAGNLMGSQGSLEPSKTLQETLTLLYNAMIVDSAHTVAVDIVLNVQEHLDTKAFLSLDMKKNGLFVLSATTSGVLLPGTLSVNTSADGLTAIKNKYGITGKARLFSFVTDRLLITL